MIRPGFSSEVTLWLSNREIEWPLICEARKTTLNDLRHWIEAKIDADGSAKLIFICTHNSRRSQLAQILAHSAARHYGVPGVETFSGGTEVTAFNPRAVAALRRAGFSIATAKTGENPVYSVTHGPGAEPLECFSKSYDQPPNPHDHFCAVMTCSAADAACPVVPGAGEKINLRYDDPKSSDGTNRETSTYDERCRQIAREMMFVFSKLSRADSKP